MSMIKALKALTAMAVVMLLLPACTTRTVTTTGAVTRTQCVTVPKVPAGSVTLHLERDGECTVDPASVYFKFSPDCNPCQADCGSKEELRPVIVDTGKAYCSGTSDFCARCIKVYDFTRIVKKFACVEYAAIKPGFFKPRPVRFLQCIDADGNNCNKWIDCNKMIDAYLSEDRDEYEDEAKIK